MTFDTHASTRFTGALPADLIPHLAAHARDADLEVAEAACALTVRTPRARVALVRDPEGISVDIDAGDAVALQHVREYLLYLFDHVSPGTSSGMDWTGTIPRNRPPLNFHTATVRATWSPAPNFLRVELECAGTEKLASGRGMHFSLLLPPEGRAPIWPRLDGAGRTVWPEGKDALHRAGYTFVTLDPAAGRFTFDVFEHEGGRVTDWARSVQPGAVVGIAGPGSGDFPAGDALLIAGDETALPAIRRILEHSDPGRRGTVLLEIENRAGIFDVPHPAGMTLTWVIRDEGDTLWDHLKDMSLPEGDSRFVWVAAEQELVRRAKARFRGELGIKGAEGYFAYYWTA